MVRKNFYNSLSTSELKTQLENAKADLKVMNSRNPERPFLWKIVDAIKEVLRKRGEL